MQKDNNLKITLPSNWIASLDSICNERSISRLGLLRLYIESGIQKDLEEVKKRITLQTDLEKQIQNLHR